MASGGGKPPSAPDPNTIIPLQSQYNRWNASGPFGSQNWSSGGPGGHETLNTSLSPQMQAVTDRAFQMAGQPGQQEYIPQGMSQLAGAVLGKVGSKYGLQGSALNTNMTQQKPQGMSPPPPQGMPPMSMQGTPNAGAGGMGMGMNRPMMPQMGMNPSPPASTTPSTMGY